MKTAYILIRIPKSGSTSLEKSMTEALAPKHLFRVPMLFNPDSEVSLLEASRSTKKKLRRIWTNFHVFGETAMWHKIDHEVENGDIISGHIHYGSPRLTKTEARYITIIRDPLDRFISEYKWIQFGYKKRLPLQKIYHFGRTAAAGKSIDYYLDFLLDHHHIYSNPATHYICGSSPQLNPFEHLLHYFWHFGILDRPDLFASGLASKTGKSFRLQHLNFSPSKSQIKLSSSQIHKFELLHNLDIPLYEKAKASIEDSSI